MSETTALGAACLAGLGARVFKSRNDVKKAWSLDKRYAPRITKDDRTKRLRAWRSFVLESRGLYASLGPGA